MVREAEGCLCEPEGQLLGGRPAGIRGEQRPEQRAQAGGQLEEAGALRHRQSLQNWQSLRLLEQVQGGHPAGKGPG